MILSGSLASRHLDLLQNPVLALVTFMVLTTNMLVILSRHALAHNEHGEVNEA